MDCGVCIGGGDYEPWEFCSQDIVKARKPHKCCECYREIPKGAEYERITGKCDGYIDTYKTCMDCKHIRSGLSCGEGVGLGVLWEEVTQVFRHMNTGCLTKIKTPSAKAYLLERWNQWKFRETD